MTYAQVITARADPTVADRVALALQRRGITRLSAVLNNEDQREKVACGLVVNGSVPTGWVTAVLLLLDSTAGVTVTAPTDPQVDTAVATAWSRLIGA